MSLVDNKRSLREDTDLLQAQSNLYRRMSANLYKTKTPDAYYHIHGSLEASTTLNMLGLESHRPDLNSHEEIIAVIEPQVQKYDIEELETLNAKYRQAGVPAFKHEDFIVSTHVRLCVIGLCMSLKFSCSLLGSRVAEMSVIHLGILII